MTDKSSFRPNLDIFGVPKRDPGWLYMVQNGELIKAGKTKDPKRRLFGAAKTWLPDIEIIGIKPFWNISALERQLHVALVRDWYKGEWYRFSLRSDYELITDGFREFYDDDRDMNSVDFIYWFNGTGLAEFVVEQHRQRLSLPRWRCEEAPEKLN